MAGELGLACVYRYDLSCALHEVLPSWLSPHPVDDDKLLVVEAASCVSNLAQGKPVLEAFSCYDRLSFSYLMLGVK